MTTSGSNHNHKYGYAHRQLRAHYRRQLALGETYTCGRCGRPVTSASEWDLGHQEGGGPRDYSGPEHRSCNRATKADEVIAPAKCSPPTRPMTRWSDDYEPYEGWQPGDLVCYSRGARRRCDCEWSRR